MKMAVFILMLSIILAFFPVSTTLAGVILEDNFIDTALVDLNRTTARVDTANHFVHLSLQSLASSVSAMKDGYGYAVACMDGIKLYEYDDASGRMVENLLYACPWAVDSTGVSVRQDKLNMWVITDKSVSYYKFNGAGMANDPALKLTGLVNVVSVASFNNTDSALVLQNGENGARITRYEAALNLNSDLVFTPGISDPVAVSMANDSPDFRLFTRDSVYYFMYDEGCGTYVEDPAKRISGLTGVIGGSGNEKGSSVLTPNELVYYLNLAEGGAARLDLYSPGKVTGPVSVSLKQDSFEQVFLDESGHVHYYVDDDATGEMVRDTAMEISGVRLNKGYVSTASYYSRAANAAFSFDAAYLTVSENKPEGTTINYFVSSDGGLAFSEVLPGKWTSVPAGCCFVLKAVLLTIDSTKTPEIGSVRLEADFDLSLEGNIEPQPAERGRNVLIAARAARLTSGEEVPLDTCTLKYPLEIKVNGDRALPLGEAPTEADMSYNPVNRRWEYTFTIPGLGETGYWPDNGIYTVVITGRVDSSQRTAELNMPVRGNIMNRVIIRTLNW